jgi:hypothetical protein
MIEMYSKYNVGQLPGQVGLELMPWSSALFSSPTMRLPFACGTSSSCLYQS